MKFYFLGYFIGISVSNHITLHFTIKSIMGNTLTIKNHSESPYYVCVHYDLSILQDVTHDMLKNNKVQLPGQTMAYGTRDSDKPIEREIKVSRSKPIHVTLWKADGFAKDVPLFGTQVTNNTITITPGGYVKY